jgi:hypothetical protein
MYQTHAIVFWQTIKEAKFPGNFKCGNPGNPPDKPKDREVEFSEKEVLREEVEIYVQPDHGCIEAC